MKFYQPELFEKAADLEAFLNQRRADLERDNVWLTRFNKPLREAIGDQQMRTFADLDDTCESGYCLT
jgi:hypothetical protein